MKKKILVDARMVYPKPHGIGVYVSNIVKASKFFNDFDVVFLINENAQGDLTWKNQNTLIAQSNFLDIKSELFEIPKILKKNQFNAYHTPSFSSLYFCPVPYIQTIHDLNHLKFGSFLQKIYYQTVLKRFAKEATVLSTVSFFSQFEISEWLNLKKEKIEIISNAFDFEKEKISTSESAVFEKYKVKPNEYFICLSNDKPHKNVSFLIESFERYFNSTCPKKYPLIVSLKSGKSKGNNQSGIMYSDSISYDEGQVLVRHARALLFPSLYEGFGRPPVEALLSGVPVIVSNINVHQEVLSGFNEPMAMLLDPLNQDQWVNALIKNATDDRVYVDIAQATKILDRYSFQSFRNKIDQLYKRVLKVE